MEQNNDERLQALLKIKELNQSGYAGCLPNGNIVDRREFPDAVPVQANLKFGVPAPKPIKGIAGGVCNRTACNNIRDVYYNHSTKMHYCADCADMINRYNRADSMRLFGHELCTLIKEAE